MTDYTDSDTITSVTTPSATEEVDYVESATISSVTTPSSAEVSDLIDAATIETITTVESTYEFTVHLVTVDYNDSALTQDVTYNTGYATAGSVWRNDTDDGSLT